MMAQRKWRTWCDDDGLVHVVELIPEGTPVLYCYMAGYPSTARFVARQALGLERFDSIDVPHTCLVCAAWWP